MGTPYITITIPLVTKSVQGDEGQKVSLIQKAYRVCGGGGGEGR